MGEGEAREPPTHERTLGDLVDPTRPETMRDVVNACSRDMRDDVAHWATERLLALVGMIDAENTERRRAADELRG